MLLQLFRWGTIALELDEEHRTEARNRHGFSIRQMSEPFDADRRRFFGGRTICRDVYSFCNPPAVPPYASDRHNKTVSLRVAEFLPLAEAIPEKDFKVSGRPIGEHKYDRLCVEVPYDQILGMCWGEELIGMQLRAAVGFRVQPAHWFRRYFKLEEVFVGYTSLVTTDPSRSYLIWWLQNQGFLTPRSTVEVGRNGEANRLKTGEKKYLKIDEDGRLAFDMPGRGSDGTDIDLQLTLTPSAKTKNYMSM